MPMPLGSAWQRSWGCLVSGVPSLHASSYGQTAHDYDMEMGFASKWAKLDPAR